MDFIDQLIRYYESEYKAGYFIGGIVGGILLTAAMLLFKFANPLSLLRGLTFPLLIAGVFMGIGGAGSAYYTQRSYAEKLKLYHKDKQAFFKQEVPKAEATHRSWFGIRVWWSIVAGAGILLMLAAKKNYLMGMGLGLLLFGIVGHIEEAISFRRNERYYKAVLQAAAALNKDQLTPARGTKPADLKGISTDSIKPAAHPDLQKTADLEPDRTAEQEKLSSVPSAVSQIADSLTASTLIAATPADIAVKESLIDDAPEAVYNDHSGSRAAVSPNFEIGEAAKDRRAGDYNGALLIRRNSADKRHCWFKKSN